MNSANETKCKYPLCSNYDKKARKFCCMGCNLDYHDWNRLSEEDRTRILKQREKEPEPIRVIEYKLYKKKNGEVDIDKTAKEMALAIVHSLGLDKK